MLRITFALLLFTSFTLHGQSTQDSTILSAAREIMEASPTCVLITLDKKMPRARTMDPFKPEKDLTVWLATNPNSRKVKEIKKNAVVTLYYQDGENGYVSLYGKATLVNDQVEKDKRWKDEWSAYYPNRNEAYLLIKIVPLKLEVISYKHSLKGNSRTWQPHVFTFTEK
ncbi:MAG: pyridoxamine 5'-phosphate oxidase family protein [Cyclobacteriaceae bacterium]|nr:pyridoxamine 5'-phosphate oxidase family protein [Cyclobacteriaceae bacterium]